MLNILTADCIAILAYDKKSHIVGGLPRWVGRRELKEEILAKIWVGY